MWEKDYAPGLVSHQGSAHCEMFNNNNNYLPDLNHFPPTGQQQQQPSGPLEPLAMSQTSPHLDPSHTLPPVSGFGQHGNFRFLSPTQVTAVPTWTPAATVVGTQAAPGMGTSWQHSVPVTMPWANHTVPHFTATVASSPSMPVYTTPVGALSQTIQMQTTPRSSVHSLHLKRRFQPADLDDRRQADMGAPHAKRYLSEKMAYWFKQLQIGPSRGDHSRGWTKGTSSQQSDPPLFDNGWQRFHEVEKRLEQDVEDRDLPMQATATASRQSSSNSNGLGGRWGTSSSSSSPFFLSSKEGGGGCSGKVLKSGAVLTIPAELTKEVHNREPVLPSQIIKSITNPCTDLVLWSPRDSILPPPASPDSSSSNLSSSNNSTPTNAINSSCSSPCHSNSSCQNSTASQASNNSMSQSSVLQQQHQQETQKLFRSGGCSSFGKSSSSASDLGMTWTNGSATSVNSEFFDCMDMEDDMDL